VRNGWKEEAEKEKERKISREVRKKGKIKNNKERINRGGRREEGRKENVWVSKKIRRRIG
jgi:hypothetical protein